MGEPYKGDPPLRLTRPGVLILDIGRQSWKPMSALAIGSLKRRRRGRRAAARVVASASDETMVAMAALGAWPLECGELWVGMCRGPFGNMRSPLVDAASANPFRHGCCGGFAFVVAGNRGGLCTVASWQFAEEMIDRLGPGAGAEEGHSRLELFAVRNGLLAHQNAEEANERRGWRAHLQEAVDDTAKNASAE